MAAARRRHAALAAALLGLAPLTARAAEVGFAAEVVPLLNSHCLMCHMPGAAQAGLSLYPDPWQALVGKPSTESPLHLVEPGAPERSYLYRKLDASHLEAGGSGDPMPFQRDKLQETELAIFRDWIAQGAKNN